MKYLSIIAGCALLSGCATFTQGSSQDITLSSNAEGATCSIVQNGVEVVPALPVPATHTVGKQAGNLLVNCSAPGYESASVALVAGKHPGAVMGGMLLTPILNAGTDGLTSSWHEYQNQAYVHLRRKSVL